MKRIIYTFLMGLLCMASVTGQPLNNLVLNQPETNVQLHQATSSITFAPGYSYTPNGGNLIANIITPITSHPHIIALGSFGADFERTDTQNTALFTNNYTGQSTKDVVYQFTLTKSLEVIISHCGSDPIDTYMTLLDAKGNILAENNDPEETINCKDSTLAYIRNFLVPGTYYVVSEGAEYPGRDGNITTSITGYYYNNEFNYPEIPSTHSADTRGVGAVAGSFAVSPTGGATYSIPIEVPVGVGGMQPSLAITYNSQAGNGVAGMGTSLSGISAITRAPKDIYHDDAAKGLTYLEDDAFMLNGQRLIYSAGTGTIGQEGAEYYPESDPFTKVIAHGIYSSGNCNTWFEVIDKNGMTYYYGQLTAARQTYTSGSATRVNAWYLNHVEDMLGNFMDYEYTTSSYYLRLSAIAYGKNKNVTTNLTNRVELTYEDRTDLIPFVLEGVKGVMDKRLKTIISKTGTSVFREYTLEYSSTDPFSRIVSVTEKNGAGEQLKPTQLEWNGLPAFYQDYNMCTVNTQNEKPEILFADQSFQAADMNGDGITDLVGFMEKKESGSPFTDNYANVFKGSLDANGQPQFLTNYTYYLGADYSNKGLNAFVLKAQSNMVDIDGNGNLDIVSATIQCSNGYCDVIFNAIGEGLPGKVLPIHLNNQDMPLYTFGDLNNDGKSEIIYIENTTISNYQYPLRIITYNNSTSSLEFVPFNMTLNSAPKKIFTSDYNGDGLTDIMVFVTGGYTIFWNQGNGITVQTFQNGRITNNYDSIGDNWMIRSGDFNGDGLMDFITNESMGNDASATSNWYFGFNNGNGTFTKQLAYESLNIFDQTFTDKDNDKFDCLVYDFDLDGKSDVVIHKAMYNKVDYYGRFYETRTYWMRSTGTSLTKVSSATSNDESYGKSQYLVSGDFNGDGKIELLNYGHNIYNGSGTAPQQWHLYRNPAVFAGSGMLASLTNGYDLTTTISYAPLTKSSVYTKGSGAVYPIIDITPPISAIQSVVYDNGVYDDNGVVGKLTENYKYSGAKVHLQGKGFLGFKSMTTTNTTTGAITEAGYTTLDATRFVPSETYSKIKLGGDSAITTLKYTVIDKGAKKFFAYPNKKINIDLDNNTDSTTYHYDSTYGYIKDEKTVYGSTNMYKKVQYESYRFAGGRYQPELITSIWKHSDDSQTFTKKTSFTYDEPKGYPSKKVENFGAKDETQLSLELTTSFTSYDAFGNLKEYKVSGSGVPELINKTEYDPTGRFVTKKYTSPASTITSFVYDTWGHVTSETDETNPANLLTTVHTYDNWGQKTSTTLSDSIKTTYLSGWDDKGGNKKYFTLTQGKGQPWVKTWYDASGRETASESVGPKGMKIESEKTYNNKGQLTKTWNRQGDLFSMVNYDYDARGRMKFQSIEDGQRTDYIYGNRTVSIKSNSNTSTKTFDAWGGIKTVADPLSGNVVYTYKSVGKPAKIDANGAISTFDYDGAGNQKLLVDPNTGPIHYTYDAAGRVIKQVDNKGNNLLVDYDEFGRTKTSTLAGVQTVYTYGNTGNETFRLTKVQTGNSWASHSHDALGRTVTETRMVDGYGQVVFGFGYTSYGQLQTTTYPGGVKVVREYDSYGNQVKITSQGQTVWELTGAEGKRTTTRLGGTMTATTTLDAQGYLQNQATIKQGSPNIRDFGYSFNALTGNLNSRINGLTGLKETFYYDALDRLTSVKEGTPEVEKIAIGYEANGNISSKTGMGIYDYDPVRMHAVTSADNTGGMPGEMIVTSGEVINYNAFNKVELLSNGPDRVSLNIQYGPDQQRWKSVLNKDNIDVKTIIFAGDYEKFIDYGVTRELYYISAPDGLVAIYMKPQSGAASMYYVHKDHLGSIVSLTDNAGVAVFKASYDAWGKQTVSLNTIGFHRGYTGHEHLPEFGLINMNGRLYDPVLGRFLSPDNYVQLPDFSQSFNRYSYCLNNPLIYTDPTGEYALIDDLIVMGVGGLINLGVNAIQGNIHSWGEAGGYFLSGAAAAEVTIYAGPVAGGAVLGIGNDLTTQLGQKSRGEIGRIDWGQTTFSGFMGGTTAYIGGQLTGLVSPYVSGLTSKIASPVIQQAVKQGVTYAASGFALNTGISLLNGNNLETAVDDGVQGALFGGGLGLMTGGISGLHYSKKHGLDPWSGESKWRTEPAGVQEQLALDAAKKGAGEQIMEGKIKDPYWKGHQKIEYIVKSENGNKVIIHYWKDPVTGIISDFKFKNAPIYNLFGR